VAHSAEGDGSVAVQAQAVFLSQRNREDVSATLLNGPHTNIQIYAGFTLKVTSLPGPGTGTYFWHLADEAIGYRARVFASTRIDAEGQVRVGIANGSANPVWIDEDLHLGVLYKLVVRYDTAAARSTLWIDPAGESSSADRADAEDEQIPVGIIRVAMRQDESNGGVGEFQIDDLVLGTEFSDVHESVTKPDPIPLLYFQIESDLILMWSDAEFTLQASPLAEGAYTNVSGAISPYTNAMDGSQVYYRLKWD
jgi:hypothetical protein